MAKPARRKPRSRGIIEAAGISKPCRSNTSGRMSLFMGIQNRLNMDAGCCIQPAS